MVTTQKPAWVQPGQQWSPNETFEQYKAAGKQVAVGYVPQAKPQKPPQSPVVPQVTKIPTQSTVQSQVQPVQVQQPYIIQAGDTLSAIAVRQGTTVPALMFANPQIQDPNRIIAGQSLNLPVKPQPIAPVAPVSSETPPVAPTVPTEGDVSRQDLESQITDLQNRITSATTDLEREQAIKDFVELSASLGIPYPKEIIDAMTKPTGRTEEEIQTEVYDKYGIEDLETKFRQRPTQTFEDIYSKVYESLKLIDLKTDINSLRDKIAEAEKKRDKAITTIQDNPWLPQASMVGRVNRASEKANKEIDRLVNQLTLTQNLYKRGQEEAESVATRALQTFEKEREYTKEELNYYLKRAEADIEAKIKIQEAEAEKENLRYYGEYLESAKITMEKEEAFKRGQELIEAKTKDQKAIVSEINRAVDQYKLNPEGFREKYIESLVATYGENLRDYISKQVYSLMPSIVSEDNGKDTGTPDSFYDSL